MTTAAPSIVRAVPALCPGGTVAIIAGGPSVTPDQIARVRRAREAGPVDRVIAINGSYIAAPWADVLYACDASWWHREQGAPTFTGLKFCIERGTGRWPWSDVVPLRDAGVEGLCSDPGGVCTGRNSGYQAINVAVHLGARRVILIGYDMGLGRGGRRHHYDDPHGPTMLPFRMFLAHFPSIRPPLDALGVDVVNCSPGTRLPTFRTAALSEVLP